MMLEEEKMRRAASISRGSSVASRRSLRSGSSLARGKSLGAGVTSIASNAAVGYWGHWRRWLKAKLGFKDDEPLTAEQLQAQAQGDKKDAASDAGSVIENLNWRDLPFGAAPLPLGPLARDTGAIDVWRLIRLACRRAGAACAARVGTERAARAAGRMVLENRYFTAFIVTVILISSAPPLTHPAMMPPPPAHPAIIPSWPDPIPVSLWFLSANGSDGSYQPTHALADKNIPPPVLPTTASPAGAAPGACRWRCSTPASTRKSTRWAYDYLQLLSMHPLRAHTP
jgi:hypothetical protein